MVEELQSIERNQTWELVNLLDKKTKIDVKWVFKVKLKVGMVMYQQKYIGELLVKFEMKDCNSVSNLSSKLLDL